MLSKSRQVISDKLGDKYNKFLGKLSYLAILLDEIDDEKEKWLLLVAPFVSRNSFFIEYLTKFKDMDSVKRIAEIFLKVLEGGRPIHDKEDIELIVSRIYDLGTEEQKKQADQICIIYGKEGNHFLRPLYEKHNPR